MLRLIKWLFILFFFCIIILGGALYAIFSTTFVPELIATKALETIYDFDEVKIDFSKHIVVKNLRLKSGVELEKEGVKRIGEINLDYYFDTTKLIVNELTIKDVEVIGEDKSNKNFNASEKAISESKHKITNFTIIFRKIDISNISFFDIKSREVKNLNKFQVSDLELTKDRFSVKEISFDGIGVLLSIIGKEKDQFDFDITVNESLLKILNHPVNLYGRVSMDFQNEDRKIGEIVNKIMVGGFSGALSYQYEKKDNKNFEHVLLIKNLSMRDFFNVNDEFNINYLKTIPTNNFNEILVGESDLLINGKKYHSVKINRLNEEHYKFEIAKDNLDEQNGDEQKNLTSLNLSFDSIDLN